MSAKREGTITLPKALAKALMQAAYWPAITSDLHEALGNVPELADLVEHRQEALDEWLGGIGADLGATITSDRMLRAVLDAWEGGSRPGVQP